MAGLPIDCPLCGGKSKRQNSNTLRGDRPGTGSVLQERICLDTTCGHRFTADISWSVDPEPTTPPPA